jgi:hypothetical protein
VVGDIRHQARAAARHHEGSFTHANDCLAALAPFVAARIAAAFKRGAEAMEEAVRDAGLVHPADDLPPIPEDKQP